MIEPIQVKCPVCSALPGERCHHLAARTVIYRDFHTARIEEARHRHPDPRQGSLLEGLDP